MDLFNRSSSNKLWAGRGVNVSKQEINLRNEFHDILYGTISMPQRGHWVAYRRFDLSNKQENYDDVYKVGPDPTDGNVRESLFQYTDELVLTRQDSALGNAEYTLPIGRLEPGVSIFYLEYDFKPKEGDQIFDLDIDDHTIRPSVNILNNRYLKKYNIIEVYPYRCDGGRVEYWQCQVKHDLIGP